MRIKGLDVIFAEEVVKSKYQLLAKFRSKTMSLGTLVARQAQRIKEEIEKRMDINLFFRGRHEMGRIEIKRRIKNHQVSYDIFKKGQKKRNISPGEVKKIVNDFLDKSFSSEELEEIKISETDSD